LSRNSSHDLELLKYKAKKKSYKIKKLNSFRNTELEKITMEVIKNIQKRESESFLRMSVTEKQLKDAGVIIGKTGIDFKGIIMKLHKRRKEEKKDSIIIIASDNQAFQNHYKFFVFTDIKKFYF
jgi:hypothetical protein